MTSAVHCEPVKYLRPGVKTKDKETIHENEANCSPSLPPLYFPHVINEQNLTLKIATPFGKSEVRKKQ